MARAPRLTYHATTFRLLGTDPAASAAALPLVEAAEAKAGRPLPAAVREWYLLDRAEQLTTDEQTATPRLPALKAYLSGFVKAAKGKTPKPFAEFEVDAVEDAVVYIGIAGDDPPVRVNDPETEAVSDAGRFTEYVLRAVWAASGANWYTAAVDRGWVVKRKHHQQAAVAGPPHLDFLAEYLTPLAAEAVTGDADEDAAAGHVYRYYGPSGRVEVVADGDAAAGVVPATWEAKAKSEDALFALYGMLRPMHGYTLRLWAPKDAAGMTGRFQKRFPGVPLQG